MNTVPRSLALAGIAIALGSGCEQDRTDRDASTGSRDAGPAAVVAASAPVAPAVPAIPTPTAATDLPATLAPGSDAPEIDFPLLDQARRLDFIDAELSFPDALRELDGREVTLVGFMAPFDDLRNMRRCMILPSYVGCKFCSPPNISQVVFVTQTDDGGSGNHRFIESPSHVTGILRLSLPDSEHEGKRQGFMYSIEDAVVTEHPGETLEQAPGHETTPHQVKLPRLTPVSMNELVGEVAELLGKQPLRPIEFTATPPDEFAAIVRAEMSEDVPEGTRATRSRAFHLMGLLPADVDWVDTMTEFKLSRRVAATDAAGERIRLLDSVPDHHPYVRLERVGEIADAMARQYFPEGGTTIPPPESNDDARRAREGLRQGFRTMAIYRYARANGIPAGARPPAEFIEESRARRRDREDVQRAIKSAEFGWWEAIPGITGSFFVDSRVGETGALTQIDPVLARPPSTTMELFRPGWYTNPDAWRHDPVPVDFADDLMDSPPALTDVLGIGGLAPLLSQWYSLDGAKRLAGDWAGDRWAIWELPDGDSALLLETRWQDEGAAIRFQEIIADESSWFAVPHEAGSNRVQVIRADSPKALERLRTAIRSARPDGEPDAGADAGP